MHRYDELTGYHVVYDDGDEEDFAEIADRDDVHILPDGGASKVKNSGRTP